MGVRRVLESLICVCCLYYPAHVQAKSLTHTGIVPAPVADVWTAFTTKEGMESWMVPKAEIDLRVGGKMRTNYHADGVIGDENTIENTILSFDTNRMLSLKATKPPATFPFKSAIKSTWSVIYFDELGPNRTRITVVGLGYGKDEESLKMRSFFQQGNAWTIKKLQEKFGADAEGTQPMPTPSSVAKNSSQSDEVLRLLHGWVGGEWIHESTRDDGGVFLVRNAVEPGPGGKSLITKAWLGNAAGMYYHGQTQIWREPGSGEIRFQNISEKGTIARGAIRLAGENTLDWNWDTQALNGSTTSLLVKTIFNGDDTYQTKLLRQADDGEWQAVIDIRFDRVDRAPERFRKMRAPQQNAH